MEKNTKTQDKPLKDVSEKQKEITELVESLNDLEQTIKETNSTKRVIWRGILTGLSGAVGATIIFGLFLTLISGILYATGAFPELNEFLHSITDKTK